MINGRLTKIEKAALLARIESGVPVAKAAKEFGISRQAAYYHVRTRSPAQALVEAMAQALGDCTPRPPECTRDPAALAVVKVGEYLAVHGSKHWTSIPINWLQRATGRATEDSARKLNGKATPSGRIGAKNGYLWLEHESC